MPEPYTPPTLSVVENPGDELTRNEASASETSPQEQPQRRRGSRGWIGWLLLVAAAVFAVQWLTQLRQVESLEAEVAGLEAKLGEARTEIVAWQAHSAAVQGAVGEAAADIAAQLGSLEALVAGAPGASAPGAGRTEVLPAAD